MVAERDPEELDHLASALRECAVAMEHSAERNKALAERLPTREKARLIRWALYVAAVAAVFSLAALTTLLIVLFAILIPGNRDTHRSLGILQSATGPKAQKAATKSTSAAVGLIIICEENDNHRTYEALFHLPVDSVSKGCPADPVP